MSTNKYYEKYWQNDCDSSGHANHTPQWPQNELRMFFNSIKRFIGRNILDIGAGEGIFIEYLKKQSKNIDKLSALEISSKAVEKGQERNPEASYYQGSADDVYPFDDEEFDTLFMTDVIEHLVDIDQAIAESRRVLKPGGNMIIITPIFNWPKKVIIASFFWEKFFYPNNPHIRFFTKKSIDTLMKKNGFERVYYRWGLTWLGIMPQNAYFVYKKISD